MNAIEKAEYENEIFEATDLAGQKIPSKTFSNCRFVHVNFSGADFYKSRFLSCNFKGCQLVAPGTVTVYTMGQARF